LSKQPEPNTRLQATYTIHQTQQLATSIRSA